MREQIAACQGVYRIADTARYFGVSETVVRGIWKSYGEVDEVEPPNIWGCRPSRELIRRDVQILHRYRGMSASEIAAYYGLTATSIHAALNPGTCPVCQTRATSSPGARSCSTCRRRQ